MPASEDDGDEFWPDLDNPALRGMYLVGFSTTTPVLYRRDPAAVDPCLDVLGGDWGMTFSRPFSRGVAGRTGREMCSREMFDALAEIARSLNEGRYNEARAVVELGYLAEAEWKLPPLPPTPYKTARKGKHMYMYRSRPWFRCRFQDGWTCIAKNGEAKGDVCFRRTLIAPLFDLIEGLNAGTLSEGAARLMIEAHPHHDKATGLTCYTQVNAHPQPEDDRDDSF